MSVKMFGNLRLPKTALVQTRTCGDFSAFPLLIFVPLVSSLMLLIRYPINLQVWLFASL